MKIGYIVDIVRQMDSLRLARKNRFKFKTGAMNFWYDLKHNMDKLILRLKNSTYVTKCYCMFKLTDTKPRIIHAPPFIDKLVQYDLNSVIYQYMEKLYIKDSYACIHGKGHQACVLQFVKYVKQSRREYGESMLVKIDLSKFFYSINRNILYDVICGHFKDERVRALISCLLRFEVDNRGLPLGNLTSQQFANILLNKFDWYVKRTLRIKYYVRYADDMYMLIDGKTKAREVLRECNRYLVERLDLVCNPKKCYISNTKEIPILGFVCNEYGRLRMLQRNKNKLIKIVKLRYVNDRSLLSCLKRMLFKDKKTTLRPATKQDIVDRLNSWYAHNKIARCEGWIEYVFRVNNIKDYILDKNNKRFIIA